MILRKARASDVKTIASQLGKLEHAHFGYDPTTYLLKEKAGEIIRNFIDKEIRSRRSLVLVAEKNNRVIGHVHCRVQKLPPIYVFDRECFVFSLFVEKKQRKGGVGAALMDGAAEWAKRRKLPYLSLTVAERNKAAKEVYRKLKFEKVWTKMHWKLMRHEEGIERKATAPRASAPRTSR
ncbi:MAG: GNAT family N-acetyltransferase [Candidatus Micrarchaeia archaeon]